MEVKTSVNEERPGHPVSLLPSADSRGISGVRLT